MVILPRIHGEDVTMIRYGLRLSRRLGAMSSLADDIPNPPALTGLVAPSSLALSFDASF
jgi:hypothetical protein